ncbi:MAG: hypothetical protein NTV32_00380 [Gammaproteobacteria bacterium]|nr:hypothetical protein [Gammaproteobacteria bacterium]
MFFEPFLKTYLPVDLLTRIDWNSIDFYKMGARHREPNTQKEFEADLIYLCHLDGKRAMLWVHAEHQSGSDPIMILPTIVTILYYQGKKPWKESLKLQFFASIIHTVDDKSRSTVLEYLIHAVHITEAELTEAAQYCLLTQDRENLMTLADRLVARGMQEGMQRGVQQGMEQGMQQGMQQGILVIAKSMLLKGLEHELISETTGLTRQELVALQKGLSH